MCTIGRTGAEFAGPCWVRGAKGFAAPFMCTIGRTGSEFAGPCWVRGAKGFAAPSMCTIGRTGAEFAPELQSFAAPFSPAGPGPESPWAAMIRFGHWNVRPRIGESLVGLGGGGVSKPVFRATVLLQRNRQTAGKPRNEALSTPNRVQEWVPERFRKRTAGNIRGQGRKRRRESIFTPPCPPPPPSQPAQPRARHSLSGAPQNPGNLASVGRNSRSGLALPPAGGSAPANPPLLP